MSLRNQFGAVSRKGDPNLPSEDETVIDERSGLTRRHMLIGAALTATSAIAFMREPRVTVLPLKAGELENLVPTQIGRWTFETRSGLVLPVDDPLVKSLYSDVLTRVYVTDSGPPIMLLIAYSNTQNGMLQVHRPEVCYPAGGYSLSKTKIESLKITPTMQIPAHVFSAESTARNEQVMYWTRIGEELPTSWMDQRAAVVRANLKRIIPDGVLVRFSSLHPDFSSARPVLEEFASAMARTLSPAGRKLLIGS